MCRSWSVTACLVARLCVAALIAPALCNAASRDARLQTLESQYRLSIITTKTPFPVTRGQATLRGRDPSSDQVRQAAALLREELAIYPVEFIQRIQLRQIVVARDLTLNNKGIGGCADTASGVFYVNATFIAQNDDFVRHTFHHELFHLFDAWSNPQFPGDAAWAALNARPDAYAVAAYEMLNDPTAGMLSTRYPGFLNRYSTSSVEEDKAEMYAYMITAYPLVAQLARNDPVIAAKASAIKQSMRRHIPAINDDFWKRFDASQDQAPGILKEVLLARGRAEASLRKGDLLDGLRSYQYALRIARRRLSGADAAEQSVAIIEQIAAIVGRVSAPLDAAQQAIAAGDATAALSALDEFQKTFGRFLSVVEISNRFQALYGDPSLRAEKRERAARARVAAGDAALARNDFRSAERCFRSASTVYPDAPSGRSALEKLNRLLADPAASRALQQQVDETESKTLLARAQWLARQGRYSEAIETYEDMLTRFPDSPLADDARNGIASCRENLPDD